LLDCENDRISSSQSNLALEEEISILKEQLEAAKRREKMFDFFSPFRFTNAIKNIIKVGMR